jgi:hypothetical protein
LEKTSPKNFSKTIKIEVFEKLTTVCFHEKPYLLLISNIHEKIMQSREKIKKFEKYKIKKFALYFRIDNFFMYIISPLLKWDCMISKC